MHKLSTQEFATVLTALRAQPQAGGSELRAASRLGVGGKATVWWMDDQGRPKEAVNVYVQDLSLTGIGFLTARAAAPNEPFVLGLLRSSEAPLLVGCEVTRAAEIADGIYRVGARFVRAMARTGEPAADENQAA